MNEHIETRRFVTGNADEFETIIKPVSGEINITPKRRNKFNASLSVSRIHRIGMALLDIAPMRTFIEPQHDFYCLTIPIVNSCFIKDALTRQEYTRNTAHLLYPDRALDSVHKDRCKLLGITFQLSELDELAENIFGETITLQPRKNSSLSLTTKSGKALTDKLIHTWGEINQQNAALKSELYVKELEDDLVFSLLMAMKENQRVSQRQKSITAGKTQISLAEEYLFANLCNPVSRAKLAEIIGVSIRSLSRAFYKRHGIGPMHFLKERRIEAARLELINADPDSTKVSDIALRYGFTELGKFSKLYKSLHNEKPSETLHN